MEQSGIKTFGNRRSRYELRIDGALVGACNYRDAGERRVLVHTEIEPDYSGQGLATELIVFALEDVRRLGKRAVAQCPMVAHYVEKHDEFDDILDHPAGVEG
jgi:predicted GNAT family acetyltransferase